MGTLIRRHCLLVLIAALIGGLDVAADARAQSGWKAGVAKAVITPTEPIWMAGYGARKKPSEGVRQVQNLAPATLAFEQGLAAIAVNRRRARMRSLPGPVDHDVPVLSVRGPNGELRAVVVGYACHATSLGDYQISGDWPGFAKAEIEKRHPGTVALFVQGCGADANPLPRYQGTDPALLHYAVELAVRNGSVLTAAVDLVLNGKMKPLAGPLKTALELVDLRFHVNDLVERTNAAANRKETH